MIGYWYFLYIILTSHCIILGMKSDILTNERKNALACPIQTVCDILWFFWNLHDFSILKNKHLKVPRFLYTLHTYSNKIIPSGETWTIGLHLDRCKFFWLFFCFFLHIFVNSMQCFFIVFIMWIRNWWKMSTIRFFKCSEQIHHGFSIILKGLRNLHLMIRNCATLYTPGKRVIFQPFAYPLKWNFHSIISLYA